MYMDVDCLRQLLGILQLADKGRCETWLYHQVFAEFKNYKLFKGPTGESW